MTKLTVRRESLEEAKTLLEAKDAAHKPLLALFKEEHSCEACLDSGYFGVVLPDCWRCKGTGYALRTDLAETEGALLGSIEVATYRVSPELYADWLAAYAKKGDGKHLFDSLDQAAVDALNEALKEKP